MEYKQRERILQYLLRQMPEPDAAEFEAQYFADDGLFEEMTATENELIDSYVRGDLSQDEKEKFQQHYLTSPVKLANVELAKALLRQSSQAQETPSAFPPKPMGSKTVQATPSGLALLMLVVIAGIAGSATVYWRLHNQIEQLKIQESHARSIERELREQIAWLLGVLNDHSNGRQIQRAEPRRTDYPPGPDVITFALTPGLARGNSNSRKLTLLPAVLLVRVQLYSIHSDYPAYTAWLETAEGARIWRKTGLKSSLRHNNIHVVSFGIPSYILDNGEYVIRLAGIRADGIEEDAEGYSFSVVRR